MEGVSTTDRWIMLSCLAQESRPPSDAFVPTTHPPVAAATADDERWRAHLPQHVRNGHLHEEEAQEPNDLGLARAVARHERWRCRLSAAAPAGAQRCSMPTGRAHLASLEHCSASPACCRGPRRHGEGPVHLPRPDWVTTLTCLQQCPAVWALAGHADGQAGGAQQRRRARPGGRPR